MDLLWHLHHSGCDHTNLLVIVDRFIKLVLTVPMNSTNEFKISKAFPTNWSFVYGVPKTVLTENGPKICTNFLRRTSRVLIVKLPLAAIYY